MSGKRSRYFRKCKEIKALPREKRRAAYQRMKKDYTRGKL